MARPSTSPGSGPGLRRKNEGPLSLPSPPEGDEGIRIALVGATREDVVKVMVEGPSGLIATARSGEPVEWRPSLGTLRFAGGAQVFVYSAEAPEALRGPEHHFAWCDELAKWPPPARGQVTSRGDAAWDNLMMGLRLGERPRAVVTTTPKPVPLLKRVMALSGAVVTRGRTAENVHLPGAFVDWMRETYGGTRLGRQELDGELIEEVEGALFSREVLEAARAPFTIPDQVGEGLRRIVVGDKRAGPQPRPCRRLHVGADRADADSNRAAPDRGVVAQRCTRSWDMA